MLNIWILFGLQHFERCPSKPLRVAVCLSVVIFLATNIGSAVIVDYQARTKHSVAFEYLIIRVSINDPLFYPNRAFCKVHKKFNYCTILKSTNQSIEAVLNKNTPYQVQNTNVNKSN
jgi:hypothetical protein